MEYIYSQLKWVSLCSLKEFFILIENFGNWK